MRLGELSQRCGECSLIDLCGEPFGEVSPCTNRVLKDMEEKEYIITAEAIQKHSKKYLSNLEIEIKITKMCKEQEEIRARKGNKLMQINNIVTLKDGRKGKVIARINDEEYILKSGKGGTISYFKKSDVKE